MCGIAGFCLSRREVLDAKGLSMCLLDQIMARGTDATGAAWVIPSKYNNGKSHIAVSKAPVSADEFEPFLDQMNTDSKRVILHTRYATQGSPRNNKNNHPIVTGKVVGVHNGHIGNDGAVFKTLKTDRIAQVDSEAAFALIDRTVYHPTEVLASLRGNAALAWFDAKDKRDLHLARVTGSPLAIGQTAKGSLIFASTLSLLVDATDDFGLPMDWVENIEPMTYLRIRNGDIMEVMTIGESLKVIA